jgi:uncharacterized protein with HEPN domain
VSRSSRRDPRTYLWDACDAAENVLRFTQGRTFEEYSSDLLLRSAVERQLEIVGEALNQMSRRDPELASKIPQLGTIVGFRNILVHGYAEVDDGIVWRVTIDQLQPLIALLRKLLADLDG